MNYKVTVNGKSYEVGVERIGAANDEIVSEKKIEKKATETHTASAGSEIVLSPMPGTIVNIPVSVGQQVKKGQTLLILEAMKMENEIVASRDGIVESISVSKGANVNANDTLMAIK
jgi:glutaconyl-CoA/methylmalonyl-CoA decarboxylase subunit gamma